jgi:hypothetical protein
MGYCCHDGGDDMRNVADMAADCFHNYGALDDSSDYRGCCIDYDADDDYSDVGDDDDYHDLCTYFYENRHLATSACCFHLEH